MYFMYVYMLYYFTIIIKALYLHKYKITVSLGYLVGTKYRLELVGENNVCY